VPTIRRFAACKIAIYADDHAPPHFHIEGRGFRAVVEIETMTLRAGTIGVGEARRALEAVVWARENSEILRAEWVRLNRSAKRD
jgi:hypothetical protein